MYFSTTTSTLKILNKISCCSSVSKFSFYHQNLNCIRNQKYIAHNFKNFSTTTTNTTSEGTPVLKVKSKGDQTTTTTIDKNEKHSTSDTSFDKKVKVKLGKAAQLLDELKDWKPIYRFKHIIAARAIQRLKIYQTTFTCFIILPWSVTASSMGLSDVTYCYYALGGSILACVMLYLMGTFSSRIIGVMYIHKNNPNKISIARLTFLGSRRDTQLHTDSFVHLNDLNENMSDIYIKLQTMDNIEGLGPMYISLKYGQIMDIENFERVFGDVSEFIVEEKIQK